MQNGLFLCTDLLGTGSYYGGAENTQKIDGYETINARIGWESETFDIVLWASNLFDKSHVISRGAYLGSMVQDGEPRMTGLTLTYRF